MTRSAPRQITHAWLLLVSLTLLSMIVAHAGVAGIIVNGIVLAAAVTKGYWMLLDFLKLRHVTAGWRGLLATWLLLVAGAAWIAAAIPLFLG